MRIIVDSNSFIVQLLKKDRISQNGYYRLSKYVLFTHSGDISLLYNTMTKQLLEITRLEEQKLIHQTNELTPSELKFYLDNLILLPNEFDEKRAFDQALSMFRSLQRGEVVTNYVILPTTDCNARCYYCFELGTSRINMSLKTASDVVRFIADKSGGMPLKLHWFGGEPLYNFKAIDYITSELERTCIKFTSFMVSNGYLFDDDLVNKAVNLWNLKRVQITLDGTSEIYNRTKSYIYKDDVNPFEKVFRNIGRLLDNGIAVKIRLNMDLNNIENLYLLVKMLHKSFGTNSKFSIYPAILFEDIGADNVHRTEQERNAVYTEYLEFCKHLETIGVLSVPILTNTIRTHRCMADSDNTVQILPNGELGKCERYTDSHFFGTIYSDVYNDNLINSWKVKRKESSFCGECPYYPDCINLEQCKNGRPYDCYECMRNEKGFLLRASIRKTYMMFLKKQILDQDILDSNSITTD